MERNQKITYALARELPKTKEIRRTPSKVMKVEYVSPANERGTDKARPRTVGLRSTDCGPTKAGLVKLAILDQPLHRCGRYCYGFTVGTEGQVVSFVIKMTPELLYRVRSGRMSPEAGKDCFKLTITTLLVNEEEEAKRQSAKQYRTGIRTDTSSEKLEDGYKGGEPCYRFKEAEEVIEVVFAITREESSLASIFVYQFFLEHEGNKGEIFRAQSVPSIVTEVRLRDKAIYLLTCHVFKGKKNLESKELKRLFKLLAKRVEYAKRCFNNHPWEGTKMDGHLLPDVLFWFTRCCETFQACPILFNHNVMYGFMSRTKTEEILDKYEEGAFLIRIGSSEIGGLVMSTKMNGKFIHVTMSPSTDVEVLKQLNVPTLTRAICWDSTPLPKKNLIGLFKAEGVTLC